MNKRIELKGNNFILARRTIAGVAFASACLCLCLLLFGFVPFWGRSMNAIAAANNVFEFINFGKMSFWYCAACVVFSILYITAAVKIIIAVI